MGNCLPFFYFNSQGADDEEHLEVSNNSFNVKFLSKYIFKNSFSFKNNQQRRNRQHSSQSHDRSSVSGNETGAVSTARRIRTHVVSVYRLK